MIFIELGLSVLVVVANIWVFVEVGPQWTLPPPSHYYLLLQEHIELVCDRHPQCLFFETWGVVLVDLFLTTYVIGHTLWSLMS